MFLIKKRRLADVQHWTVALSNSKSSLWRFSVKMLFLKILQYSRENTCVKFLRRPVLKNIYGCLLLNWFYEVTVLNFVSGSHLKPSRLNNIGKIPNVFKPELFTKFGVYTVNMSQGFVCSWLTVTTKKASTFSPWTPCLKVVIVYCYALFD